MYEYELIIFPDVEPILYEFHPTDLNIEEYH